VINYIWVAFIALAIVYAGYLEVAKKPPIENPAPVVVVDYDGEAVGVGPGVRVVEGFAHEGRRFAEVAYDFGDSGRVEADLGIEVAGTYEAPTVWDKKPRALKPTSVTLRVRGDGSGNLLSFVVVDRDGEEFRPRTQWRLSAPKEDEEEWRAVTVALGELDAGPGNPGASVDFPVRVRARLTRSETSEVAAGTVGFDSVRAVLPPMKHHTTSFGSSSWMGIASSSIAEWARFSINLAIGLIGLMMFWLGLMRIAEKAGLVDVLARAVKPVMVLLFPDVPKDSPAMGAILMNVAANMLGLGNAATPLGIKAMKELQADNPSDEYASNAQCMLLAINTSSVTFIPATIFAYRAAQGSMDIMKFWPVMIGVTTISTIVAVVSCKLLEKLPMFRVPASALAKSREEAK
jgi:spore maturation protein A